MAVIAVVEAALLAIFIIANMSGPSVPVNFLDQQGTVAAWKASGFVASIVDSSKRVMVDEDLWHELPHTRRVAVRALLTAYFARTPGGTTTPVLLIGARTHQLLPESGGE